MPDSQVKDQELSNVGIAQCTVTLNRDQRVWWLVITVRAVSKVPTSRTKGLDTLEAEASVLPCPPLLPMSLLLLPGHSWAGTT